MLLMRRSKGNCSIVASLRSCRVAAIAARGQISYVQAATRIEKPVDQRMASAKGDLPTCSLDDSSRGKTYLHSAMIGQ